MRIGSDRFVLQPRDRQVLELLSRRRLLDRDQLAIAAGFHSRSRVNERLLKLKAAGLIVRYFTASETGSRKSVYAATRKAAIAVGSSAVLLKWKPNAVILGNAFVAHQLTLNDVFIAAETMSIVPGVCWRDISQPIGSIVHLIPDALIESQIGDHQRAMFLEVDLGTEPLSTWTKKVALYQKLAISGEYQKVTQAEQFSVLVVVTSEVRLQSLRRHIMRLTEKLFWFATLKNIKQVGFWSSIWARPAGDQEVPPGA